ncbi:WD40 repeat domain-containing protein [Micromonospora sp. NPDC051296]|uniref:WD40 repeat domain-containing protein n=1 Tax=Micromonospora sp. NPDC051296 TaxID=3155046 RepID=UPI00342B6346
MSAGELLVSVALPGSAGRLAWSPDGRRIAVGGAKRTAVVEVDTGGPGWQVPEWETVRSLEFSPDGGRLAVFASASDSRHRLRMLDAASGHEIWQRPHSSPDTTPSGGDMEENPVGTLIGLGLAAAIVAPAIDASLNRLAGLEFSPDGRLLGFAGLVLDARDGNERIRLPPDVPAESDGIWLSGYPPAPAFSADSGWLATGSGGVAKVIDTSSGQVRWSAPAPDRITMIDFDEHSRRLVVVCHPRSRVLVLNASSGEEHSNAPLGPPIGSGVPLFSQIPPRYLLSPDRRLLAVYNWSRIGVFTIADGVRRFQPHSWPPGFARPVRARFSPAGNLIAVNRSATGDSGRGVMLIHAHSGATVWETSEAAVDDVAFSPDGDRLAVASGSSLRVYDTGLERFRWRHQGQVERVAATSAGIRLVASAGTDQKVTILHADSGEPLREWSHSTSVNSIAFSPDGQHLATGSKDGGARLYQTVSGHRRWQVAHGRSVNTVAFIPPDGAGVVTASGDKTARRLRLDTGEEQWQLAHPQPVTQIAVSPDGLRVATACADRSTRLVDAVTGTELFRQAHETEARALAFGPAGHGDSLLAIAADVTVLLAAGRTGAELHRVIHRTSVTAVAVSPDGALLATGTGGFDRTVRLYDLTAAEPALRFERELLAPVNRLVFNPVSRRLVVLTENEVKLLDPDGGIEVARIVHSARMTDVAVSPDGAFVVVAGADGLTRAFAGE